MKQFKFIWVVALVIILTACGGRQEERVPDTGIGDSATNPALPGTAVSVTQNLEMRVNTAFRPMVVVDNSDDVLEPPEDHEHIVIELMLQCSAESTGCELDVDEFTLLTPDERVYTYSADYEKLYRVPDHLVTLFPDEGEDVPEDFDYGRTRLEPGQYRIAMITFPVLTEDQSLLLVFRDQVYFAVP